MTDVTDNFNRANGSLGANWIDSPSFTGLSITSNAAGTAVAAWSLAYWNPATNTFANDQHSQISVVTAAAGQFAGAVVRHQGGGSTSGYFAFGNTGTGQILLYRIDSGAFNLLSTGALGTINPGDTVTADAVGTTIRGLLNGVPQASATDATYTSGQPGIAANNGTLDNWAAGPIIITTIPLTGGFQSSSPVIRRSIRVINT